MGRRKVYEVEDILDSKYMKKKMYYLIKWNGYSVEESTWEPESHLNCPIIIAKYKAKLAGETLPEEKIIPKRAKVSKGRGANVIISSPSTSASSSASSTCSVLSIPSSPRSSDSIVQKWIPDSPVNGTASAAACSGKSKGIAKFFKPSTDSLPAIESFDEEDKEKGYPSMNSSEEAIDSESRKKLFEDGMKKFQKMISRVPGPPLTIKNDYDLTPPPQDFVYVNETLYGPGVDNPDSSFLVGCSCYVIDEVKGSTPFDDVDKHGCCINGECECISQNPEGIAAYDSDGLLLPGTSVIYECNKKCCCSIFNQPCKNRLIQMGRQVSLTIVRLSDDRGWGVIANHDIPQGMFIDLYLGEVITTKEASLRFHSNSAAASGSGSYLFDLDFNYDFGTECEFTLDAFRFGNVSHFFNHSCSPNLKVYPCFIENLDPRLHSIAFFTNRPISKGEQLTFDYMGIQGATGRRLSRGESESEELKELKGENRENDDDEKQEKEELAQNLKIVQKNKRPCNIKNQPIKCLCGSNNCRQYIYI